MLIKKCKPCLVFWIHCQLYIKAPFRYSLKVDLWKAETCHCYDLVLIFYIIKVVLDYKIIYILLIIESNGDASPENRQ